MEQRNGRLLRPGNGNDEVEIFNYVTKGTFDAYLYQLVEHKQRFISQINQGEDVPRVMEDIDTTVLTYAEIKALATGDDRIRERMELSVDVEKLNILKNDFSRQKYRYEDVINRGLPAEKKMVENQKRALEADKSSLAQISGEKFSMTLGDTAYTDKKAAGEALLEICANAKGIMEPQRIGQYRGMDMQIQFDMHALQTVVKLIRCAQYSVALGTDALGNIIRLRNALSGIDAQIARCDARLMGIEKEIQQAKSELEKPFEFEQTLKEKTERLNYLNIALDIDHKLPQEELGEPDEPSESEKPAAKLLAMAR